MEYESNPVEELASRYLTLQPHAPTEALDEALWKTYRETELDFALCSDEPTRAFEMVSSLDERRGARRCGFSAAEAMLAQWLAQQAGWDDVRETPTVVTGDG